MGDSNNLILFQMLETALSCLLEGRRISESCPESLLTGGSKVCAKFWNQLQMLLKKMLATTISTSTSTNKSFPTGQSNPSVRSADAGKLRELYKMSLKSTELSELPAMHALWTSQ